MIAITLMRNRIIEKRRLSLMAKAARALNAVTICFRSVERDKKKDRSKL